MCGDSRVVVCGVKKNNGGRGGGSGGRGVRKKIKSEED